MLPPCVGEFVQMAHAWSYNGKIGRAFNTRRKEHRRNVELCKNSGNIIDKGNYRHRETLESWHTACQKTLTTYNSKHLPEQYRKNSTWNLRHRVTVPDEFGTGLKFVRFSRVNTREPRNRTNLRPPNRTNSRVNRRKRTNFRPVPNSSGTV